MKQKAEGMKQYLGTYIYWGRFVIWVSAGKGIKERF
jgi:hypothetical protein